MNASDFCLDEINQSCVVPGPGNLAHFTLERHLPIHQCPENHQKMAYVEIHFPFESFPFSPDNSGYIPTSLNHSIEYITKTLHTWKYISKEIGGKLRKMNLWLWDVRQGESKIDGNVGKPQVFPPEVGKGDSDGWDDGWGILVARAREVKCHTYLVWPGYLPQLLATMNWWQHHAPSHIGGTLSPF